MSIRTSLKKVLPPISVTEQEALDAERANNKEDGNDYDNEDNNNDDDDDNKKKETALWTNLI